jgi:hypothetical protein
MKERKADNTKEMLPTNGFRWIRGTQTVRDSKGKEKLLKRLFLQQCWVSPFVEGSKEEWRFIPVTGKWEDTETPLKQEAP